MPPASSFRFDRRVKPTVLHRERGKNNTSRHVRFSSYGKKVQGIINLSKKKGNSKEQGPQSTGKRKEIMYCKERARVFTLGILLWFVGPLCLHYIFFSMDMLRWLVARKKHCLFLLWKVMFISSSEQGCMLWVFLFASANTQVVKQFLGSRRCRFRELLGHRWSRSVEPKRIARGGSWPKGWWKWGGLEGACVRKH